MKKIIIACALLVNVALLSSCDGNKTTPTPDVKNGNKSQSSDTNSTDTQTKGEKYTAYIISSDECKDKKICEDCASYNCEAIVDGVKKSIEGGLLKNAEVKEIEANSQEGKAMLDKYKIEIVPALVIEKAVENEDNFANSSSDKKDGLNNTMDIVNDMYVVKPAALGSSYYLDSNQRSAFEASEQKKQEELKKQVSELSDKNKEVLGITADSKPQLDYFVMAFCPYGNPADENASKIYDAFGDSVNVVPHYILSSDSSVDGGYNSLHGPQEAHQGIRELCVLNEDGAKKFFEFTLASNDKLTSSNADSKWKEVAGQVGVDASAIEKCKEDQGLQIAKEQIEINQNTKTVSPSRGISSISASPTILVNGEEAGRSANQIKEALCKAFGDNKPEACNLNLDEAQTGSGSCD